MKKAYAILALFWVFAATLGVAAATGDRLKTPVMIGQGTAVTEKLTFDLGLGGSNPFIQSTSGGAIQISDVGTTFTTSLTGPLFRSTNTGSAATPAFSFSADTDTGIYQAGAGELDLTVNGILRVTVDTGNVTSTLGFIGPTGSPTAPTYGFTGDSNTGIYHNGADRIDFSTGGVTRFTVENTDLSSAVQIQSIAGTNSAPGYSFGPDTDTGMYQASVSEIDFTVNSTKRLTINTAVITSTLPLTLAGSGGNTPYACTRRHSTTNSTTFTQSCSGAEIVLGGGCNCATGNVTNTEPNSTTSWGCQCTTASASNEAFAICCTQ